MDQKRPVTRESMILEIRLTPEGANGYRAVPVMIEDAQLGTSPGRRTSAHAPGRRRSRHGHYGPMTVRAWFTTNWASRMACCASSGPYSAVGMKSMSP